MNTILINGKKGLHIMKLKQDRTEKIKVVDTYTDYIQKQCVNACGTVDRTDHYYITYDNRHYVCYRFEFNEPSELSTDIAQTNRNNMTNLLNDVKGSVKIGFLMERKAPMQDVFNELLMIYRSTNDKQKKIVLAEELDMLDIANKMMYAVPYIFLEAAQEEVFLRRSLHFLKVYPIEKENAIAVLHRLNNEL